MYELNTVRIFTILLRALTAVVSDVRAAVRAIMLSILAAIRAVRNANAWPTTY